MFEKGKGIYGCGWGKQIVGMRGESPGLSISEQISTYMYLCVNSLGVQDIDADADIDVDIFVTISPW